MPLYLIIILSFIPGLIVGFIIGAVVTIVTEPEPAPDEPRIGGDS